MSSCFSTSQRWNKPAGQIRYNCVICRENLSSKGVCKRHLEDQHVSPKVFKCEKCAERFTIKSEAKKHCSECGMGLFLYITVRPEEKRVYGCEFTGEYFSSLTKYVEHLLRLSEICERSDIRPDPDSHRKLRALLGQPLLQQHVAETSNRLHGSRHAWKNLRWNGKDISKAIEQLEYAYVRDDGRIEFGRHAKSLENVQNFGVYLDRLLCAGTLQQSQPSSSAAMEARPPGTTDKRTLRSSVSSANSSGAVTPVTTRSQAPAAPNSVPDWESLPSVPSSMPPPPEPVMSSSSTLDDVKGKRHLSDYSRFYVPHRQPPGPPTIAPDFPYAVHGNFHDTHQPPLPLSQASTTSLPFRPQEGPVSIHNSVESGLAQPQSYHLTDAHSVGSTVSSDAASGSTLMSNYQEPQLVEPTPFDYGFLPTPQGFQDFSFLYNGNPTYDLPSGDYMYPREASVRTSSIATGQTYVDEYNEYEQKMSEFQDVALPSPAHQTFLWGEDEDDQNDFRL